MKAPLVLLLALGLLSIVPCVADAGEISPVCQPCICDGHVHPECIKGPDAVRALGVAAELP